MEMYLAGVSARRVEDIMEALWGMRVSAGTVSDLNQKMDERIEAWRNRKIEKAYPYVYLGISYWGGDLRRGFDLTKQDLPGRFDFIWIHPPYWNIVQYRGGSSDLSNCESYEQFREMLMVCLERCYESLEVGGRLAILIGDARRNGRYKPIVKDVLNFPCGEIRSIIIKMQHNCTSDRKSYGKMEDVSIRHEYCIVF